jgi:serine/threonine protein kinase
MSSPFLFQREREGVGLQRPLRPGGIRPPLSSVPEKRAVIHPNRMRSKSPQPNLFPAAREIDPSSPDLHKTLRSQLKQYTVDEFVLIDKVHIAGDSAVFKSLNKRDGKLYALKQRTSSELGRYADILHEAKLNLEHPHIVRCFGAFWGAKYALSMVFEWADGGDLLSLVKQRRQRQKPIAELDVWRWSKQLFSALELLHSRRIIHRDIKCSNLLLFSNVVNDHHISANRSDVVVAGTRIEPPPPPPVDPVDKPSSFDIRVADLGVARKLGNGPGSDFATTLFGTPLYMSPELVDPTKGPRYTNKTDIWSSGVTIYEMAALVSPFSGHSMAQLTHAVRSGRYRPLPPLYSKELSHFISKCLSVDPDKRPDAKTAVQICSAMESKLSGNGDGGEGKGVLGSAATEPGMLELRRAEAISAHRHEKRSIESQSKLFSLNPPLHVEQSQHHPRPSSAPTGVPVPIGTYAANVLQSQHPSEQALQYHDRNSAGDSSLPLVARAKALAAESRRISEAARDRASLIVDNREQRPLNVSPPPLSSGTQPQRKVVSSPTRAGANTNPLESTFLDEDGLIENEVNELMVAQRLDSRIKASNEGGVTRVRVSRKAREAAAIAASSNINGKVNDYFPGELVSQKSPSSKKGQHSEEMGIFHHYKKRDENSEKFDQQLPQRLFKADTNELLKSDYDFLKQKEKIMNQRPSTAPSMRNHQFQADLNTNIVQPKPRSPIKYQQQLLLMGGGDSVQARSPKVADSPILPLTVDIVHSLKVAKEKEKKEKEDADYKAETSKQDQLAYQRARPVTAGRMGLVSTPSLIAPAPVAAYDAKLLAQRYPGVHQDSKIENSHTDNKGVLSSSHPLRPEINSIANELRFGGAPSIGTAKTSKESAPPIRRMNNADLYMAELNKDPKSSAVNGGDYLTSGIDYHKSGNRKDRGGDGGGKQRRYTVSGGAAMSLMMPSETVATEASDYKETSASRQRTKTIEDPDGEDDEEEDEEREDNGKQEIVQERVGIQRRMEEEIAAKRRALVERNKELWRKQMLRAGHVPKE